MGENRRTDGRIDRQTDMTNVISSFRVYTNVPNQTKCGFLSNILEFCMYTQTVYVYT